MEAMRKLRKSMGSYADGASSKAMAASFMQPIEEAADASALMGETKPLPDGSTLSMDPVGDFQLAFGLPVRDTSGLQPWPHAAVRHQGEGSDSRSDHEDVGKKAERRE